MSWEARPWHVSYRGQMFDVLSGGSNVGRIVRAKRNMKIANSSQIKIFFHRFLLFLFIDLFIFVEGVTEEICNSLQTASDYYIIHPKSSKRGRIFVFWWQQAWGQNGWILAEFLSLRFTELSFLSVYKNARKQRGSHHDRTSLINKGLIILPTDFALIRIKNDSFLLVFLEPGKNAICVCNTVNPRVSSMFSLVWPRTYFLARDQSGLESEHSIRFVLPTSAASYMINTPVGHVLVLW